MCNPLARHAKLADAAEIAGCLSALGYGTTCGFVTERLASFADSSSDAVFVVSGPDSTSSLGVVSVHLLPLFHAAGLLGRITSLAVNQSARGKGIGKILVSAAEHWAWSKGAQRMEVTSGDHRPVAHAFYHAVGYTLDERRFIKHAVKAS
jgi:GNAT superfamily N-acetyltransferase